MRKQNESLHDYKVRMIDSISASYCAAKWYNATIWLGHGQTTSCHHPPGHWIPTDELKNNFTAIHNTPHKKLMRKMMQEGVRPNECEYCWKVEDIGRNNISDRVYKTEIYNDDDIEKSVKSSWTDDVELRTLEISFDRACNLKCSYCNPAFSTAWVKDINTYGPYLNIQSDGRGHFIDNSPWAESAAKKEEDNPYIQAFWKWWEHSLCDNLDEIRITGGEPIMHKSTWKLFEWFKNNPNRGRKMRFAINSNLNPETNKVLDRLIAESWHVPNFEIYTSCEAVGKHAEYIRDGLNYNFWKNNIHRILKESNVKKLHVMMTINSLCLNSITEFMTEMLELRKIYGNKAPTMTLNILRFPSFQSAAILPDDIKNYYKNKLISWVTRKKNKILLHDSEIAHIQRLIDYLDIVKTPHKNTPEIPKLYNDFKSFYSQYDLRRNKNFKNTFDEIFINWFDSIDAIIPTKDDIQNNKLLITHNNEDPATIDSYNGGDDDHEKILGGWNVHEDKLG